MSQAQQSQGVDVPPLGFVSSALAAAFADPLRVSAAEPHLLEALRQAWGELAAAQRDVTRADLGLGELPAAEVDIEPLCRWLALPADLREQANQAVFGMVNARECPPYETEYCHWHDATYRAHQLADIAGFYQAFGLQPDSARPQRQDHICLELEFVGYLLLKLSYAEGRDADNRQISGSALVSFVRDHVRWWMPTFARSLEKQVEEVSAEDDPQRQALSALAGAAQVLRAWVAAVRLHAGVERFEAHMLHSGASCQPAT